MIMFSTEIIKEIKKIDDEKIHQYRVVNGALLVSKKTLDKTPNDSNSRSGFLVFQDGCIESEGGDLTTKELARLRNKIHII